MKLKTVAIAHLSPREIFRPTSSLRIRTLVCGPRRKTLMPSSRSTRGSHALPTKLPQAEVAGGKFVHESAGFGEWHASPFAGLVTEADAVSRLELQALRPLRNEKRVVAALEDGLAGDLAWKVKNTMQQGSHADGVDRPALMKQRRSLK